MTFRGVEYFTLGNGNQLPKICFGPGIMTRKVHFSKYKILKFIEYHRLEQHYLNAIKTCLQSGVRFIDYSVAYGREDLVSNAIKDVGIIRKDVFLTTRVTNRSQIAKTVREDVEKSLVRFDTDYVDLLMFHWPVTDCFVETWKEIIQMRKEGLCKNIGVANCHQHHIEELIRKTGILPDVNQVEIHPLFSQKPLVAYCQSKKIQMEAYTPLARMDERLIRLPRLKEICSRYSKSASQVILRWHIQNGVIPVFRSLTPKHQQEALDVFDFSLSQEDMATIDSFNINARLRYDPDNCDFSIL